MIAALVLAAELGTLQLADWTEVRARATTGLPVGLDVTLSPSVKLAVTAPRWQLSLGNAFFLSLPDLEEPPVQWAAWDTGMFEAAWRDRFVRLSVTENATYGLLNTVDLLFQARLSGMAQPIVNGVPGGLIEYGNSLSALLLEYSPAARWHFSSRVAYWVYGGIRPIDRSQIAFQRTASAQLTTSYVVSRLDTGSFEVDGWRNETESGPCLAGDLTQAMQGTQATCAPDSFATGALLRLRHSFSPLSDLSLAGGSTFVRARIRPDDVYSRTVYPSAVVTYEYRLLHEGRKASLRLDGQLAPGIDFRNGGVNQRAQLTGTATWLAGRFTFTNAFGVARSFGSSEFLPSSIVFATARGDYQLKKNLFLSGTLSYYWEYQDASPAVPSSVLSTGIASVALTATTLPWRF
jgi:hypothetical protein